MQLSLKNEFNWATLALETLEEINRDRKDNWDADWAVADDKSSLNAVWEGHAVRLPISPNKVLWRCPTNHPVTQEFFWGAHWIRWLGSGRYCCLFCDCCPCDTNPDEVVEVGWMNRSLVQYYTGKLLDRKKCFLLCDLSLESTFSYHPLINKPTKWPNQLPSAKNFKNSLKSAFK